MLWARKQSRGRNWCHIHPQMSSTTLHPALTGWSCRGQRALPLSLAEAVWHFPAAKRTRFGCKIGLVTVTPYWPLWSPSHTCGCQPAQVKPWWAANHKCPQKQLAKGCKEGFRWGQTRRPLAKVHWLSWNIQRTRSVPGRWWLRGSLANGFKERSSCSWFPWTRHCAKPLSYVISCSQIPRGEVLLLHPH